MSLRPIVSRLKPIAHIASTAFAAAFFVIFSAGPVTASALSTQIGSTKPQPVSPNTIHNTFDDASSKTRTRDGVVAQPNTPATTWSVTLTTSTNDLWPLQTATLTATASQDVGPTPYFLSIYDETSHTYVANCASGTTCTAGVTQSMPTTHYYEAFVAGPPPATGLPSNIQAISGTVGILWHGVNVGLTVSNSTLPLNVSTTLTATTSSDVGPSPFWTEIFDVTAGTRLQVCGTGTTCSITTSQAVATTHKFVAYVSLNSTTLPPANTIATSIPAYVTWTAGTYRVSLSGVISSYGHETLTATANQNVGPTPYWIEIYNLDTGARLTACGTGTTCSITTAMQIGANHYIAFVSSYSTTLPPLNTQASSKVVTGVFRPIP